MKLRNLCERLVVDIPREGERAFYFLQGHLEEMNFSTKEESHPGIAHFNLPSQILCKVINVQLLVEPNTREIYFGITLLPEIETNLTVPDPAPPEIQKHEMHSFWKILTASVTTSHGVSNRQQSVIPSFVIPSHGMHLGVLATASHAVMSGTMFVVYYKQRASQFVIRLNKYLEAMDNNIHVGMRFKMRFKREDSLEISFFGTIVGIEDFSPEWPDSRWRSLQVKWDEPARISRPDRVSPWEIEPVVASTFVNVSDPIPAVKSKMLKLIHNSSSKLASNSLASPLVNSNNTGLNDSSSFLSELQKDKANSTSAPVSFCNWFCCCFK
ncbi:hypothetical protein K1719_038086 [Acacia pycnantha]|nr:hypothetical protein K1719_038086 [Acacia pycnantha]